MTAGGKPRNPLLDYAASLYKMVYWSGGEMRVFIFPPMGKDEK